MNSILESNWNYAVTYIEMYFNENIVSKASGFFWSAGNRRFLVTNWHVLSGRNPETNAPMDDVNSAIPNTIRFSFYRRAATNADGTFALDAKMAIVPLYKNGDFNRPLWLEHSRYGKKVDVASLDITEALPADAEIKHARDLEGDADVNFELGQDVFIIGYPFGMVDEHPIPVWKRASIATEPTYEIKKLPKIYVDTASRPGMSGSVVIGRFHLNNYKKKDGTMSNTLSARRDQILGIYSGRIGAHDVKAQLGIVWRESVIDAVTYKGSTPNPL